MRAIFTRRLAGPAVIAVALAGMTLAGAAAQAAPQALAGAGASASAGAGLPSGVIDPCPPAAPGDAGCAALISEPTAASAARTAARPAAADSGLPTGYSPADLQQAYGFQGSRSGSGQTVAVVTAYGDPDAAGDLAMYRGQYGLAPCTVADGCFEQVSQTGSTTGLPTTSAGWSANQAESIDMISAICPNCHILVVEANSSAISDMGIAENEAVARGADVVDNDWGIPEVNLGSSEPSYDPDFDHPGVAITAPSGNGGFGAINYPAASQWVTAVGGTILKPVSGNGAPISGYAETASEYSASGCSAYEPKPAWQTDTDCANRMLNDLAADSDPSTPVIYYDTPTEGGWGQGSGTTVAAAIVAASYALAGAPASGTYPASYPYTYPGGSYTTPGNAYLYSEGLNNITSGNDGTCAITYECTAGAGYNGPTGLGSPNTALSLTSTGETGQFQVHTLADICLDGEPATTAGGASPTGGEPTATAPADLHTCDGSPSQTWTALPNGTLTDTINITVTGTPGFTGPEKACLDADGTTSGSPVYVETNCGDLVGDSVGTQWVITASQEIVDSASGLCLTDPGDATADGTTLEIETCAGSPAVDQQWTAPYDRPEVSGPITSQTNPKVCVDDTNDATTNGNKIQIWSCLGDNAQNWTIEPDGTIQINGSCLVTDNDGTVSGTVINLHTCTGDTNQQWTERSNGTLVNTRSGTCLDDPHATTTDGTQLQIWACDGLVQQSWTLR